MFSHQRIIIEGDDSLFSLHLVRRGRIRIQERKWILIILQSNENKADAHLLTGGCSAPPVLNEMTNRLFTQLVFDSNFTRDCKRPVFS